MQNFDSLTSCSHHFSAVSSSGSAGSTMSVDLNNPARSAGVSATPFMQEEALNNGFDLCVPEISPLLLARQSPP